MKKIFLNIFFFFLSTGFVFAQDPTISNIPNQTINEDGSAGPISFTVSGTGTLTLSATTSNNTIIPPANVTFGGSGTSRTVTITPAANQNGTVIVQVTVTNGAGQTASDNIVVTITAVNDLPTITPPANQTVNEDGNSGSVSFTIGDVEDVDFLTVTASSNNTQIIPNSRVVLGGSGANRTVTITPASNEFTTSAVTITLTVTDPYDATTNGTFNVTVTSVNDVPSFTKGSNITVLQNSSAYSQAWATGISAGPSNESSQTLTFNIASNNNTGLFSSGPSVNSSGVLSFTPANNQVGTASIAVNVQDNNGTANSGVDQSANQTFSITVSAVNQAPTINAISTVNILEDASQQTVNLGGISSSGVAGENLQNLTVTSTSNNTSIIPNPNVVYTPNNATGSITFTPSANTNTASGAVTVTVKVKDDAGTDFNGVDTVKTTFQVNVTAVNDEPGFTKGADVTVLQNSSAYSGSNWASSISRGGGSDENGQAVTFAVSNNANSLFTVQPAISSTGTLTFTPATNQRGTATVTVSISDDGGTANSGDNTSNNQTFSIVIDQVNQEPTLDNLSNLTILEDAAQQTVNLTGIKTNAFNLDWESTQTLTVTATSSNTTIIPNPTVTHGGGQSATGSIAFTPNANQYGTVTITVTVTDNGGTANGGDNVIEKTFTVTVTNVNDEPSFTAGSAQTVLEDAGAQSVNWASSLNKGANESSQNLTFVISNNTNSALFSAGPAIDASGILTYTPAQNKNGTATITLYLQDDGGVANSGDDQTNSVNLSITVTAVNDEPLLSNVGDVTVNEDAGASTINLTGIGAGGSTDENGQTFTFSITSSNTTIIPTPTISYTPGSSTGTINFTPAENQFTTTPVVFTVTLQDNGLTANSGDDTKVITINVNVTSVNDAPTLADIANPSAVLEDAGGNITINLSGITSGAANESQTLSVTATSGDATVIPNPTVTYSSASTTGSLTLIPQPDQNGVITITVTVNDGGATNNATSKTFQVTITAVNDEPGFTKGSNQTVLEDASTQTISSWATSIRKGPVGITNENSQTLTFVIASNSNTALFEEQPSINGAGNLSFKPALNKNGTATINVYVDDNGGTANGGDNSTTGSAEAFTITVTAVNDEPTLNKPVDLTIDEDAGAQTVNLTGIGRGGGSDESTAPTAQTLIVSSTSNTTTKIPNPTITSYSSPGATGTLTFTPVANQNTSGGSPVTITVRVTDDGGTANSGDDMVEKTFNVTINAQNDAPTYVAISDSTIFENLASGTDIGTLSTTDPDGDVSFTYSLVAGAGSSDNASFQIVGDKLKSNAIYNFEVKSSYSIRVQTQDQGGLNFSRIIPITIKDANDTPTQISINDSTIAENELTNTTIGTLTTTDEDAGQSFTYTLVNGAGSDNNSSFSIVGDQLKSVDVFNYEVKSSYTIRVRTTDNGTPTKFFERAINVVIENVNDTPTWISIDDSTVAENEATNTLVGILSTTDADVGQTHTYTLVAGVGSDNNSSFVISGDQIKTNAIFNYEVKNSYTVRIKTTDNGTPAKSFERAIPIKIDDANDTPTWITISDSSIAENEPEDAVIGTLSTTDEDVPVQNFTYTLVSGLGSDDNASFQILNDKLKAKESYNFEAKKEYTIRVRTTDSGTPNKFFDRAIIVLIEDVNEQPTLVYPDSAAIRIAISNTLKWKKVLGAISYRVEVYEQPHTATTIDTTLTAFFRGDVTGGDTTKSFTNFKNYKKYFWRVYSMDSKANISFWSFVWHYRTVIGAPIHKAPVDKKLWMKVRDTLRWNDTMSIATKYDIQLATNSTFTTGLKDTANIDSLYKFHYYDSLTTNLTYYWRMRARNTTDTSSWTSKWQFRVVPKIVKVDSVTVKKNQFNFASDTLRILFYPNFDVGDTAALKFEYSLNNGTTWFETANILVLIDNKLADASKIVLKDPAILMGWLSKKDFSFIENDSVKIRVSLNGIGGVGTAAASTVFSLDNNPPSFSGITTAFAETTGNAITITWPKGTDKNGPVRYYIYWAARDSTIIEYNAPKDSVTNEDSLKKTITGFQNYIRYYLSVRARDRADNFDANTVVKGATPSRPVKLLSISTPKGVIKDSVYIPFEATAANDDTLTMIGEFSKNDGVSWFTVGTLGGRATKITSQNFKDSVLWRTRSDGEYTESMTTKFRLTAYGMAVNSQTLTTTKFYVDNTPPYIDSIKSVTNNGASLAGSVVLNWVKPTDLSSPTNYQLYVTETQTYKKDSSTRAFYTTKPTLDVDTMWASKLKAMTKYYFHLWYKDTLGNIDSTKIAKAKQFTTGMLTDYTYDNRILTDDFGIFSNAWKSTNKNVADISPYRGTFPAVSIDNDGLIDIEDLTLFVRIWNWAFINGKGGTASNTSIAKGGSVNESGKSISVGEVKVLPQGKSISIPIFVNGVKEFDAMSITLNYNTNAIKIDSFVNNLEVKKYFGESIVTLFNSQSKFGYTTVAFGNFGFKEFNPNEQIEIGNIYGTILNNQFDGSMSGAYEIYSVSKNMQNNGGVSLNYSVKPVLPSVYSLEQNYPNPFNPQTIIKYSLPVESNVKIIIYNLLGEKIAELVNEKHNAGIHEVKWQPTAASGMYFYKIEAVSLDKSKRFVQTRKMLFLK